MTSITISQVFEL